MQTYMTLLNYMSLGINKFNISLSKNSENDFSWTITKKQY